VACEGRAGLCSAVKHEAQRERRTTKTRNAAEAFVALFFIYDLQLIKRREDGKGDYMPAFGVCLCIGERLAFDFGEAADQELSWRQRLSCEVEDRFADPDP
jgi:hypothetical protein